MKRLLATFASAAIWLACGASGDDTRFGFQDCMAGDVRSCSCSEGGSGRQTCGEGGAFGECQCTSLSASTPSPDEPSGAGECVKKDGGASAKKCQVCDFSANPQSRATCPVAPSCSEGILGVPATTSSRADLSVHIDNGNTLSSEADGGVGSSAPKGTCLDPQLRIRLQKLKVHRGGGEAYCVIEANDGITSEAAVTMKTSDLKEGDEFPFPVGQGTLWGQGQPECTSNNLTLTYYCFKVVDNSAWSSALEAMGSTAAQVGGSPAGAGPYGWAFGLGGAAANAAAAAIDAAQKDENRIKIQQTIAVSDLLDLTNGRTWTIRSSARDCNFLGICDRNFDWELTVQAWGCAERLVTPN